MDLDRLRRIAGLQYLGERYNDDDYDDDDGLSAAERELVSKSDRDLKKKGVDTEADLRAARKKDEKAAADKKAADVKAGKAGAEDHRAKDDKEAGDKKAADNRRETAKKDEKEDAAKRGGETQDKEDAKKDRGASVFGSMVSQATKAADKKREEQGDTPAEKKKRGRSETERTSAFKSWVQSNPNATRKEAIAKAAELGMNARHANTKFYQFKKKVNEFWILVNPNNARVLAEHSLGSKPLWVRYESLDTFDSEIFTTRSLAESAAKTLFSFGHETVLMKMGGVDEAYDSEEEVTVTVKEYGDVIFQKTVPSNHAWKLGQKLMKDYEYPAPGLSISPRWVTADEDENWEHPEDDEDE